MSTANLPSKSSAILTGTLIFFVPFFTYLTPENLKQLSNHDIFEIFISLLVILSGLVLTSIIVEKFIKLLFKKKVLLFPFFCLVFYLNFFYTPLLEPIQETLYPRFGFIGTPVFIIFELFCLFIILIATKFYSFSIRMILIFSIIMLIKSFAPLINNLSQNNSESQIIQLDMNDLTTIQEEVNTKRNIYYIILDAMVGLDTAEEFSIVGKNEAINNLNNSGLRYIDKSQSSYSETKMTMTSIMLLDYHQRPQSPKYSDSSNLFPRLLYNNNNNIPLLDYLDKTNSLFLWTGNDYGICRPSNRYKCINLPHDFLSKNLYNFVLTTPIPKILQRIFKDISSQNSIDPFLEYVDKYGIPSTSFFSYIHQDSPHWPYLLTSDCGTAYYPNTSIDGYSASYKCALKRIKVFMKEINNLDPDAIVIFQGDHGWGDFLTAGKSLKEKYLIKAKIFNAVKAPAICFEKYGSPQTTVNTIRFALNCAYGYNLPFKNNIHYQDTGKGSVVERVIYE